MCFDAVIESEASVKRHHSVNDVLGSESATNASSTAACQRNNASIRPRILRPKSEGSFNLEGLRVKRASSFGVRARNSSQIFRFLIQKFAFKHLIYWCVLPRLWFYLFFERIKMPDMKWALFFWLWTGTVLPSLQIKCWSLSSGAWQEYYVWYRMVFSACLMHDSCHGDGCRDDRNIVKRMICVASLKCRLD